MRFTSRRPSQIRLAAVALVIAASMNTANAQKPPQDTTGALQKFDILGVRLGMTEAEAVTAIKQRFPEGTKDSRGRIVKLKMSDYTWPNSVTRAPMRAGIRFEMHPDQKSNYDFVKILINDGKVWAIWRDDTSSTYSYEKTIGDMGTKYAGASPINGFFDFLIDGQRKGGGRTLTGFELYEGSCRSDSPPFGRVNQGDSMRLDGGCNKFFRVDYGVISKSDVKTMGNGSAQLVDLDAGRAFFASMSSSAKRDATKEAQQAPAARL